MVVVADAAVGDDAVVVAGAVDDAAVGDDAVVVADAAAAGWRVCGAGYHSRADETPAAGVPPLVSEMPPLPAGLETPACHRRGSHTAALLGHETHAALRHETPALWGETRAGRRAEMSAPGGEISPGLLDYPGTQSVPTVPPVRRLTVALVAG